MTPSEATVTLTDTEFTLKELEEFIDRARRIEGIEHDALVVVKTPNAVVATSSGPVQFELSASSAYRGKE